MHRHNTVSTVSADRHAGNLQAAVSEALTRLGPGILSDLVGRSVLIKANFNSPHPFPASSAPDFLSALIGVLRAAGAGTIRLGDSCGLRWAPAEAVAAGLGIPDLAARLGVEWVNFDAGPWRSVNVQGALFKVVKIAEAAYASERIVYACCIKTHPTAGFSASLKHAIGFLPPEQRHAMHQGDMARRIAEINLAVKPHLVLADGRKCFTMGGPARGWVRRPGIILASTDRVALDERALEVLKSYFAFNRLAKNPREEPQIREAIALGIGTAHDAGMSTTD
jgi:uncharacterized protein (DUF362 family)